MDTEYARRMVQRSLLTSANYWQERGDDNFPPEGHGREECYRLAQDYRELYDQHVAQYGMC